MPSKVYQADWLDQVSDGIDFRRTHNSALTDSIVTRAQHLAGQDRDLVLAMYRDGHSAAQIARLGNQDPRQVRRRIRRVLSRLTDPTFIFVITNQSNWSTTRRKVAQSLFQAGRSIRQTANDHNLKIHQVRRHRTAIIEQLNTPLTTNSPNRNWQTVK
ncbi:MAG: hypothetical protein JKY43_06005 [Phycisphaerales bacterium]|nr:hypothetical protein [Phycisphaerales bacterium]